MPLLKRWYNGYNWGGESVYNPYDVLLFLDEMQFEPYWYNTGSPRFLIDFLMENKTSLANLELQRENLVSLSKFDIDNTSPTALMFQTGYLTIDKVLTGMLGEVSYTLKYPNLEVQRSLNDTLLSSYLLTENSQHYLVKNDTYHHLVNRDFNALVLSLNALFSGIPHDWYRNNRIARYEGYWSSIFFTFFTSLGYRLIAEDTTSKGQIDLTLDFEGSLFLFEFKVIETIDRKTGKVKQSQPKGCALQQLIDNRYVDKYRDKAKPIYQIGLEFSEAERKIVHYDIAEY